MKKAGKNAQTTQVDQHSISSTKNHALLWITNF